MGSEQTVNGSNLKDGKELPITWERPHRWGLVVELPDAGDKS